MGRTGVEGSKKERRLVLQFIRGKLGEAVHGVRYKNTNVVSSSDQNNQGTLKERTRYPLPPSGFFGSGRLATYTYGSTKNMSNVKAGEPLGIKQQCQDAENNKSLRNLLIYRRSWFTLVYGLVGGSIHKVSTKKISVSATRPAFTPKIDRFAISYLNVHGMSRLSHIDRVITNACLPFTVWFLGCTTSALLTGGSFALFLQNFFRLGFQQLGFLCGQFYLTLQHFQSSLHHSARHKNKRRPDKIFVQFHEYGERSAIPEC